MADGTPIPADDFDQEQEKKIAEMIELGIDVEYWYEDTNESFLITFSEDTIDDTGGFHPTQFIPFVGQRIFGYHGLLVKFSFRPDDGQPTVHISWKERFAPNGEQSGKFEAVDLVEILGEHMSVSTTFVDHDDDPEPTSKHPELSPFVPPGTCCHKYAKDGQEYEVWTAPFTDRRAREIVENLQVMMPMFVAGGVQISMDEPAWVNERWTVYLVYAVNTSESGIFRYSIRGYSTSYRTWFLNSDDQAISDAKVNPETVAEYSSAESFLSFPCRRRINQFFIFPPFQSEGHGTQLYNAIINDFQADPGMSEIAVEDPSETFDFLRDVNDLVRLRYRYPAFRDLKMNPDVQLSNDRSQPLPALIDPELINAIRMEARIASYQLRRLVEMQTYHNIPVQNRLTSRLTRKHKSSNPQDRAYYFWRLLVKMRLHWHNRNDLVEQDPEDIPEILDNTLNQILQGYESVLKNAETKTALIEAAVSNRAPPADSKSRKRKVIEDDSDDDGTEVVPKKVHT